MAACSGYQLPYADLCVYQLNWLKEGHKQVKIRLCSGFTIINLL